jgi:GT2 family glycosyltransferase
LPSAATRGGKPSKPVLSAIVVSQHKGELLERCLLSLQAALSRVGGATELVLVLNEATAEESRSYAARYPDAVVIGQSTNTGFSPAVGLAIRRSRGEWIALFNDDTVVEPDALELMLAAGASAEEVGSVAAQMRFFERSGTINSAGIEVDRLGVAYDRLLGCRLDESEADVVEVFGASGGAALYRRQMLDEIGSFDESFFAYLEDVDVAWRARMAGWRCLYVPGAVVVHHHSRTLRHGSVQKHYLVGRNRVRLLAKNADSSLLRRNGARMLAHDLAYVLFVALTRATLAPLRGRLAGVKEWRRYRRAGAEGRRSLELPRPAGLRAALRRNRAWPS